MRPENRNAISLVELLVMVAILGILLGLVLASVHRVRAAAHRISCASNMRQLGIALTLFHDDHGLLPPGMNLTLNGGRFRLAGWGVPLLPYIDQTPLYDVSVRAFGTAKSVLLNPPHQGLATVVPGFNCPVDPRVEKPAQVINIKVAFTGYLGNEGTNQFTKDGVLFVNSTVRMEHLMDGSSVTILIGERPPSHDLKFGWWYAGSGLDMNGACEMLGGTREINHRAGQVLYSQCPEGPYSFGPGVLTDQCDMFHFWSLHPGGAHFAMCDGSVHFLSYSADAILPALATRAGNEALELP